MSRARTRPTREETRDRLLRGAARVFDAKGIGTASIEDICDEAGFSRGAFYSNFAAKDELVMALLELEMRESYTEMDRLYEASTDSTDFINSMESDRRRHTTPLAEAGPGLYVELLLYAMRNPENRPKLVEYENRRREENKRLLQQIVDDVGREYPLPLDDVASLIMAIDTGIGVNKLLEPERYPENQFSEFMRLIHELWLAAPPDALD